MESTKRKWPSLCTFCEGSFNTFVHGVSSHTKPTRISDQNTTRSVLCATQLNVHLQVNVFIVTICASNTGASKLEEYSGKIMLCLILSFFNNGVFSSAMKQQHLDWATRKKKGSTCDIQLLIISHLEAFYSDILCVVGSL